MVRINVVTIALGMAVASIGFAGDGLWRPVTTLSLGPAWANPGANQTFFFQSALSEAFVPKWSTAVLGDGEIFLGRQHRLAPHWQAQLGVAGAATTPISRNGDIWQDSDPNFNNFFYNYKISHAHVAVKGKLLTDVYSLLQPYVSGSLGVGFNHAYHYNSVSKLFEVLPEPSFAPQTTTALTYTLGIGLQRELNQHWSFGVGYEFSDWGKTTLASAPEQLSNGGLSLHHVYTQQLQFSLSFFA